MKRLLLTSVLILFNLTQIYSQLKDSSCQHYKGNTYLKKGDLITGITVGYSLKSKVPAYGTGFDYMLHQINSGIISTGFAGRYNTSSEDILNDGSKLKTRNITAGIKGSLNFNRLGIPSLVPFAGIMLGYNYSVTEYEIKNTQSDYFPDTRRHSFYIFGQAGIYFFVNRNFSFNLIFGTGNIDKSNIEGGINIKF